MTGKKFQPQTLPELRAKRTVDFPGQLPARVSAA